MRRYSFIVGSLLASLSWSGLCAGDTLDGIWKAVFRSDAGEREYSLDLTQTGDALSGTVIGSRSGPQKIQSGKVRDGAVRIEVERELDGNSVVLALVGKRTSADRVAGTLVVDGNEVAEFVMERLPSPIGTWSVVASAPEGDQKFESVLVLRKVGAGFAGVFESDRGRFETKSCAQKGEQLAIDMVFESDQGEVPIHIDAKFVSGDVLEGEWKVEQAGYSGPWRAERQVERVLAGLWSTRATTDDGVHEGELDVAMAAAGIGGKYRSDFGEVVCEQVKLDGKSVRFELTAPIDGEDVTFVVEAEFRDADSLVGEWAVKHDSSYSGKWEASRRQPKAGPFAGKWSGTVEMPSGEEVPVVFIVGEKDGKLALKLETPIGEYEPQKLRVEDGKLLFQVLHNADGEEVEVHFVGKLAEDGAIEGIWEAADYRGEWGAMKAPAKRDEAPTRRL